MVAVVATAGATNANSYVALTDAESFLASQVRLTDSAWSSSTDELKGNALIEATRQLDQLCSWTGSVESDTQALRWPRAYVKDPDGRSVADDAIPAFLANATALFAFYMFEKDRFTDRADVGIDSVGVAGAVSVKFSKMDRAKLMPEDVYNMVRFYADVRGYMSNVPVIRA